MNLLKMYWDWKENNEQEKAFYDMWINKYGKEITDSNNCKNYHIDVAYEMFKMQTMISKLEERIRLLEEVAGNKE